MNFAKFLRRPFFTEHLWATDFVNNVVVREHNSPELGIGSKNKIWSENMKQNENKNLMKLNPRIGNTSPDKIKSKETYKKFKEYVY